MRLKKIACVALATAVLAPFGFLACDFPETCPEGERAADVQDGKGGYVCVPSPETASTATPSPKPTSTQTASPQFPQSPATDASSPPPSYGCSVLGSGTTDVVILAASGDPPTLSTTTAPDGVYELAQGSFYNGNGWGPPISEVRATLVVSGAELMMGAQVTTSGALQENESYTVTLTGNALTLVCANDPGPFGEALLPGTPGITVPAQLAWDATNQVVTLRLPSRTGADTDLLFRKL